ncbi:MAG: hypothetical protein ABUL60_19335 [Myxococcales bacterium]
MRELTFWAGIAFCCVGCSSPEKPIAPSAAGTTGTAGTSAGGPSAAGTGGGPVAGSGGVMSGVGGGSAGADGMAPACNQLELDAPDYAISFVSGSPPEPKGGAIADGTYFYSHLVTYGIAGADIAAGRGKVVITGMDWEAIEDNDATGESDINPSHSWSATLASSGTEFTLTQTCPGPDTVAGGYTADGDTLTLYITDGGVKFAEELKRQ